MSIFYSIKFNEEKYKKLLNDLNSVFPPSGGRRVYHKYMQSARRNIKKITEHKDLCSEDKYLCLLLLLKSISNKGRENEFIIFEALSLNEKAIGLLKKTLLNQPAIDKAIADLTAKNAEKMKRVVYKPGMKTAEEFKQNATQNFSFLNLGLALSEVLNIVQKKPNFASTLQKFHFLNIAEPSVVAQKVMRSKL